MKYLFLLLSTLLGLGVSLPNNTLSEREKVVQDFKENYLGSEIKDFKWKGGSKLLCSAGTLTEDNFRKVLQKINYFRRFVGLNDDIVFDDSYNKLAQKAALIMYANDMLNHHPPGNCRCYSEDGFDGASHSNLYSASYEEGIPEPITAFVADYGGNREVGHRRWLLYSRAKIMGYGATKGSSALYVITEKKRSLPNQEYICYPPKGYVPYQLIFKRWSLSIPTNSDCDFTKAKVSMRMKNGAVLKTNIVCSKEYQQGYGDPTLAWEVGFMPPDFSLEMRKSAFNKKSIFDNPINVKVDSILVGKEYKSFNYSVTIIDP